MARVRVILESPYAGDIKANLAYLNECLRDSISRGEAPFASHRLYTECLNDTDERTLGIALGYVWWNAADKVVFYIDLGVSPGMQRALGRCVRLGKSYEFRRICPPSDGDGR